MSMRLKGVLMNHLHAQLEQHLFADAVELQDVPCEMTFQTAQGYMEYENEKHSYLPVFHLIGEVKEIRGDFPFHISSLYFGDEDSQYLTKDILYYPNPQEIAHMITVGQFYTKRFRIPEILDAQEYSFPARVNLTILPPPNQAQYEMATAGGDFVAETDLEKLNLPIVYVELAGTGITRKTDKLLDYYGIDFDEGYEIYPLTAEASGYVDPPLMMYMEAPEMVAESEKMHENMAEMYITREEEIQMIRDQREREQQKEMAHEPMNHEYQVTQEDLVIAQAARSIEQRVANRVKENEVEKAQQAESVAEHDEMMDFLEQTKDSEFIMLDQPQQTSVASMMGDFIKAEPEEEMFGVEDEVVAPADMDLFVQPDVPEQYVEMGHVVQPESEKQESNDGLVDEKSDMMSLADLQGADVEDASLQAKLDEARAKELAKNVASEIQEDIVKEDEKAEKGNVDKKSDQKVQTRVVTATPSTKRGLPSNISGIADEYAAQSDAGMDEYQ